MGLSMDDRIARRTIKPEKDSTLSSFLWLSSRWFRSYQSPLFMFVVRVGPITKPINEKKNRLERAHEKYVTFRIDLEAILWCFITADARHTFENSLSEEPEHSKSILGDRGSMTAFVSSNNNVIYTWTKCGKRSYHLWYHRYDLYCLILIL